MTPALAAYLRDLTTRCEQATPGPWYVREGAEPGEFEVYTDGRMICWFSDAHEQGENDAVFAVTARTDLPTLVRLVRDAHAALGFIESAALFHPDQAWPDEMKAQLRRIGKLAHEALARAETLVKEGG